MAEKIGNIHPGEVLQEDYLVPLGMTPYALAKGLGITPSAIGEILAGKRRVTPATALRLERFFGAEAQFWLNLQAAYQIRIAEAEVGEQVQRLPRRPAVAN